VFIKIWHSICFRFIKACNSGARIIRSARSWIYANSVKQLYGQGTDSRTEGSPPVPVWVLPKTKKRAVQRAKDRASRSKWDLDTAIFLFGILAIVFILVYQGIGVWITAPVAVFGFIMVWLVGFNKARRSYRLFLPEEVERYPDTWKDYYKILDINPGAKPEIIAEACNGLSQVLRDISSTANKTALTKMLKDAEEARQVLCDSTLKATYDYIYWSSFNAEIEVDIEFKKELIILSQSIYKEVVESPGYSHWKIPLLDKFSPRAVKAIISFVLVLLLLGTTLAFSNPENALAAPFRDVAMTVAQVSSGVAELITSSREIAASSELATISTAFQSMRIDEGLIVVSPVNIPENDMVLFPSREFGLYPEYLDRRYSQFKYTVNTKGIMEVDTSWATTDGFLKYMRQVINRLERAQ